MTEEEAEAAPAFYCDDCEDKMTQDKKKKRTPTRRKSQEVRPTQPLMSFQQFHQMRSPQPQDPNMRRAVQMPMVQPQKVQLQLPPMNALPLPRMEAITPERKIPSVPHMELPRVDAMFPHTKIAPIELPKINLPAQLPVGMSPEKKAAATELPKVNTLIAQSKPQEPPKAEAAPEKEESVDSEKEEAFLKDILDDAKSPPAEKKNNQENNNAAQTNQLEDQQQDLNTLSSLVAFAPTMT